MVARVTVDAALDRLFDYAIPASLAPRAVAGARVKVPFGHRTATGYIVEVVEEGEGIGRRSTLNAQRSTLNAQEGGKEGLLALGVPESATPDAADAQRPPTGLKPLLSVEGDRPFLLPGVLRLARWIAAYYCAPVELCVRGVLPAPVREGRSRDKTRLFVEATGVPHPEPRTKNQEPGTKNQEPGTKNQEPRTRNQEPGT